MNEHYAKLRKDHFEENWLAWAALHHFLPATLLRELSYVVVDRVSNGALSFSQLFDETISEEASALATWVIRTLPAPSQLAEYLQYRIRAFAWQNDEQGFLSLIREEMSDLSVPSSLERAVKFGASDFAPHNFIKDDQQNFDQASMNQFVRSFVDARTCITEDIDNFMNVLPEPILAVVMPLSAVMLKHLGDLYADIDEWSRARTIYEQVNRQLEEFTAPEWADFVSLFQSITTQSLATSIRYLEGVKESFDLLDKSLSQESMENAPILFANASFDAYVASHQAAPFEVGHDSRSTVLFSPMLLKSNTLSTAMGNWLNGKFTDASTRYWAVLRRQIALGSATESRTTKAWYARNILDELNQTGSRQGAHGSFNLAIRLLIESGNREIASKVNWSERLVSAFVDQECVEGVIAHAESYSGSINERQHVVIELCCAWVSKLDGEQQAVATLILSYLAKLALRPATPDSATNIGGHSLEALNHLAKHRPEFRELVSPAVAQVIAVHLELTGFWTGTEKSLKLATEYVSVFSEELLRTVVEGILSILDKPGMGMWPIVRAALHVLVARKVKILAKDNSELGHRIVEAILRIGVEQESENARVIFYLHDFDFELLKDPSIKESLHDTLLAVRQQAKQINSSDVVEKIQALLLAPVITGCEGVGAALEGIRLILASASCKKQSIALSYAYDPLLLLVNKKSDIAHALEMREEEFISKLRPLLPLVIELWRIASRNPSILSEFSFAAPTSVDFITVHNWAFTSIRFAELFQESKSMEETLDAAKANPSLASGITLARASQMVAEKSDSFDVSTIRNENSETFYSALGRRLVVLEKLDSERGFDLCLALTEQCLKLGPSEIDAAVFLVAARMGLASKISHQSYSYYTKRLGNMRDLRLKLLPILQLLEISGETDDDE